MNIEYKEKYLNYKKKYLELQNLINQSGSANRLELILRSNEKAPKKKQNNNQLSSARRGVLIPNDTITDQKGPKKKQNNNQPSSARRGVLIPNDEFIDFQKNRLNSQAQKIKQKQNYNQPPQKEINKPYFIKLGDQSIDFDDYSKYKARWFELKNDGLIKELNPMPPTKKDSKKESEGDFKKYTIFPSDTYEIFTTDDYDLYLNRFRELQKEGLLDPKIKPKPKSGTNLIADQRDSTNSFSGKDKISVFTKPTLPPKVNEGKNKKTVITETILPPKSYTRNNIKETKPQISNVLKNNLADIGLEINDVPGDGNCFFHSLSQSINGNTDLSGDYRKMLSNVLKFPKYKRPGNFITPKDLEDDNNIGRDGVWIENEWHFIIMSRLLERPIRIYKNYKSEMKYIDLFYPGYQYGNVDPVIIAHLEIPGGEGSLHYVATKNNENIISQLQNFLGQENREPTTTTSTKGRDMLKQQRQENKGVLIPNKNSTNVVTRQSPNQNQQQTCPPGSVLNSYGLCMRRSPGN